jgi:tetratricopeptide (TPR) repeat protein
MMGRNKEAIKAYSDAIHFASKEEKKDACIEPSDDPAKWNLLAKAHIGKGNVHARTGELEKSLIEFDAAIAIDKGNVFTLNNKGIVFANQGRYDEAVGVYDMIINPNPHFRMVNKIKCASPIEPPIDDDYIEIAAQILKNPLCAKTYYNKGIALYHQGIYDEALECFEKLIGLNPKDPDSFNNKGVVLHSQKKYEQAILCCKKALELDPTDSDVQKNEGLAFCYMARCKKAVECYDRAIEVNPNDADAFNYKGLALHCLGKYQKAIGCYDEAIEINYGMLELCITRALLYVDLAN